MNLSTKILGFRLDQLMVLRDTGMPVSGGRILVFPETIKGRLSGKGLEFLLAYSEGMLIESACLGIGRIACDMPLACHSRGISCFVKQFTKR